MDHLLVLCVLCWGAVSSNSSRREGTHTHSVLEDWQHRETPGKMKRSTLPANDSQTPTLEAVHDYFSQLETNAERQNLSRALPAVGQDTGQRNNVTKYRLQEILELLGDANARGMRDQLLLKEEAVQELMANVTQLQGTIQALQDSKQQQQETLQQTTEEKVTLQEKVNKLESRLQDQEEEIKNLQETVRHNNQTQHNVTTPQHTQECGNISRWVLDCGGLKCLGISESGVYDICIQRRRVSVYCQFSDGQAWTVFLARGRQTPQENFTRPWQDYKKGFGDAHGEYWLGNDNLHAMTGGDESYYLRVESKDSTGKPKCEEERSGFNVAAEDDKYRLKLRDFYSTRKDWSIFPAELITPEGMPFSTFDRDHSDLGCDDGGTWHFYSCSTLNPTQPFSSDKQELTYSSNVAPVSELKMMIRRQKQ